MSELYMMVTITNRKYMSRFADFYRENQVDVDVLFKKATLIENNTEVCLSFKEEDCIFL